MEISLWILKEAFNINLICIEIELFLLLCISNRQKTNSLKEKRFRGNYFFRFID